MMCKTAQVPVVESARDLLPFVDHSFDKPEQFCSAPTGANR